MRSRYTIREPGVPYFITCTVVQWIPLFTRKAYFDILIDSLQFCRQHKGLKIYAYVILDNHLHLVVAGDKLTDIIRDFKSYTAKLLIARLEQDQKTWVLNQFQYYKQPNQDQERLSGLAGRVSPPADRLRRDAASEDQLPAP